MTLLCVPILVEDVAAALDEAAGAKAAGANLVEFRIDGFFSGASGAAGVEEVRQTLRLVSRSPLPCIVTCRPTAEGGQYDGEDAARVALFEHLGTAGGTGSPAGESPPRYLDVELDTYTRSANLKQKVNLAVAHGGQSRDLSTSLILSTHDFDGRPADLTRRVLRMRDEPAAAVLKIAYRARSVRDNLELFDLLAEADRPTIALGMGEFGLMSRVLAPKFGGFLTFAALRDSSATAPGQPTVDELIRLYRFRSIGPGTRVYGVLGWPVAGSLSPAVHNAAFAAAGVDAVYLPIPVPPEYEHFKATLGALLDHPRLDFAGCSVTMPHKAHLVRFAQEWNRDGRGAPTRSGHGAALTLDATAAAAGAANTLCARPVDKAEASVLNTDGPGAANALRAALGGREGSLAGTRVAVIGPGGAGRSVASWLALNEGAEVVLFGRDAARAGAAAAAITSRASDRPSAIGAAGTITGAPLDDIATRPFDVYINCTPVGMAGGPAPEASPTPESLLAAAAKDTLVLDTVYRPVETPLLRAARVAGLRTIDGVTFFAYQAALQSAAWGVGDADPARFDEVARAELARRTPDAAT